MWQLGPPICRNLDRSVVNSACGGWAATSSTTLASNLGRGGTTRARPPATTASTMPRPTANFQRRRKAFSNPSGPDPFDSAGGGLDANPPRSRHARTSSNRSTGDRLRGGRGPPDHSELAKFMAHEPSSFRPEALAPGPGPGQCELHFLTGPPLWCSVSRPWLAGPGPSTSRRSSDGPLTGPARAPAGFVRRGPSRAVPRRPRRPGRVAP